MPAWPGWRLMAAPTAAPPPAAAMAAAASASPQVRLRSKLQPCSCTPTWDAKSASTRSTACTHTWTNEGKA
eukprot:617806-Prorocentrum_minimum.AAC.1